jgi:hypothetical protein
MAGLLRLDKISSLAASSFSSSSSSWRGNCRECFSYVGSISSTSLRSNMMRYSYSHYAYPENPPFGIKVLAYLYTYLHTYLPLQSQPAKKTKKETDPWMPNEW